MTFQHRAYGLSAQHFQETCSDDTLGIAFIDKNNKKYLSIFTMENVEVRRQD
jgi:hypothetical protein